MEIKRFICRMFGHSFEPIDILMAEIEASGLNKKKIEITCRRCGKKLKRQYFGWDHY